jgi:hypothetical protein
MAGQSEAGEAEDELMAAYRDGRQDAALAIEVEVGIAYLAGMISKDLAKRIIAAALGEFA